MHKTVENLLDIQNKIKLNLSKQTNYKIPKIIAVSRHLI